MPPPLSRMLSMPGLLFEGIVRSRNELYSLGLLPRRRLPAPVISVGNITLGGSGKTPLVAYTAGVLRELGAHPALLSRGYGRTDPRKVRILAPGEELPCPENSLGDEPALIRRRVPEIWLGISADRYRAAGELLKRSPDLTFILDDGFQHLRLDRDLDILVVDCSQPFSENYIFPRGSLREPLSGINRAQVIIMNVCAAAVPPERLVLMVRKYNKHAAILHCTQAIDWIVPYASWTEGAATSSTALRESDAFLVAAIGNPERFRRDVESLGIRVRGARFYRDHHRPSPEEWTSCVAEARSCGSDFILVTEKDAIKIVRSQDFPLLVAVQAIRMHEASEFRNMLKQIIGRRR